MKKIYILLFVIFLINIKLFAITYEIKQDSTGDFTTIQAGVEAAADGDTILVYPGTYYENVDYLEKSITIGSLNMTTGDSTYINSTVIDGNQNGSCVWIKNVNGAILYGFKLINGTGSLTTLNTISGGGIAVHYSSNITIKNCLIKHNSSNFGGGISVYFGNCCLENNIIISNQAFSGGGGIMISSESYVIFSEDGLNSIYLNYSSVGNDISIFNTSVDIVLDKFTVSNPDNFFIRHKQADYTFSCQQAVIDPVEADLFVSTEGDNNNSGLTAQNPLQTMAFALIKIQADSLHPHTIHVADGVYSNSTTGEMLPLNLRSYVGLVGESEENTIIDGEYEYSMMAGYDSEHGMVIKNFTMENISSLNKEAIGCYFTYPEQVWKGFSLNIENITIRDIYPAGEENSIYGIQLLSADSVYAKNITLEDNTCNTTFGIHGWNFYGENIKITGTEYYNNFNKGGGITFARQSSTFPQESPNKIVGLELSDNEHFTSEWPVTGVLRLVTNTKAIISNATIADNSCPESYGAAIMVLGGELTLLNSIIYDNSPAPIRLEEDVVYGPAYLTVENSLVNGGTSNIIQFGECYLNWGSGNLNAEADPEWTHTGEYPYQLSNNSPCIDAGILDLPAGMQFPEYDLAGNPRIYGETVDMGAYEYPGYSTDEETMNSTISLKSYPNPFRNKTVISFRLAETAIVNLKVYNAKGQLVRTLIDAYSSQGNFNVNWKGVDRHDYPVANGVYFARLIVDDKERAVQKLIKLGN